MSGQWSWCYTPRRILVQKQSEKETHKSWECWLASTVHTALPQNMCRPQWTPYKKKQWKQIILTEDCRPSVTGCEERRYAAVFALSTFRCMNVSWESFFSSSFGSEIEWWTANGDGPHKFYFRYYYYCYSYLFLHKRTKSFYRFFFSFLFSCCWRLCQCGGGSQQPSFSLIIRYFLLRKRNSLQFAHIPTHARLRWRWGHNFRDRIRGVRRWNTTKENFIGKLWT